MTPHPQPLPEFLLRVFAADVFLTAAGYLYLRITHDGVFKRYHQATGRFVPFVEIIEPQEER